MSTNGAIESFEIERKYQVSSSAVLPPAAAFAAAGLTLDSAVSHELRAAYFDTPEGALAEHRVAVRMRIGGKDEGWHMKARSESGARELLWPENGEMPAGLRAEIEALIGSRTDEVVTIANLRTTRVTQLLLDASGAAVIELADDRVEATNELADHRQQWREWEAELMPGADEALLDRIEPLLIEAGAERVRGTSKIQRTMQRSAIGAHRAQRESSQP